MDFDGHGVVYALGELDELVLAYATSIHKSQGSEYPAVVIVLALQHYTLPQRNLLYTAITRGKKRVVVIGQIKAIAMAVKNSQEGKRLTGLVQALQHGAGPEAAAEQGADRMSQAFDADRA